MFIDNKRKMLFTYLKARAYVFLTVNAIPKLISTHCSLILLEILDWRRRLFCMTTEYSTYFNSEVDFTLVKERALVSSFNGCVHNNLISTRIG